MSKELPQPPIKKTGQILRSIREYSAITAAGFIAFGCTGVACATAQDQQSRLELPTPSSFEYSGIAKPEPTPENTSPWTIIPSKPAEIPRTKIPTNIPANSLWTEIPANAPKTPTAIVPTVTAETQRWTQIPITTPQLQTPTTPTTSGETSPWTVIPPKTLEPASTPNPPLTPESTPSPTPKAKEAIYLNPGETAEFFITSVTIASGKPEKRMFDLVFKGDSANVKIEIRFSNNPGEVYQEGSEISLPPRTTNVTATITARSGARQTCLEEFTLYEYSRQPGWTNLPINTTKLDEKVCTINSFNTLQVIFSDHRVNEGYAFSDIIFLNTAPIKQEVIFWVPDEKCFKAAQRQFLDNNKLITDYRVTIPAKSPDGVRGVAVRTMHTIFAFGEKASPPICEVLFDPILKNQD